MNGLCECQCGQPTPIAKVTDRCNGRVKGQPMRFVWGHTNARHRQARSGRKTPEWCAWKRAKQRCTNPNNHKWADYGGRGIKFLFTSFEQFFAELGPRPEGMTLDRKNNDGNYEPGNVRWATKEEQNRNRRRSGPKPRTQ